MATASRRSPYAGPRVVFRQVAKGQGQQRHYAGRVRSFSIELDIEACYGIFDSPRGDRSQLQRRYQSMLARICKAAEGTTTGSAL